MNIFTEFILGMGLLTAKWCACVCVSPQKSRDTSFKAYHTIFKEYDSFSEQIDGTRNKTDNEWKRREKQTDQLQQPIANRYSLNITFSCHNTCYMCTFGVLSRFFIMQLIYEYHCWYRAHFAYMEVISNHIFKYQCYLRAELWHPRQFPLNQSKLPYLG